MPRNQWLIIFVLHFLKVYQQPFCLFLFPLNFYQKLCRLLLILILEVLYVVKSGCLVTSVAIIECVHYFPFLYRTSDKHSKLNWQNSKVIGGGRGERILTCFFASHPTSPQLLCSSGCMLKTPFCYKPLKESCKNLTGSFSNSCQCNSGWGFPFPHYKCSFLSLNCVVRSIISCGKWFQYV